jgi:hypothetical protein
MENFFTNYIQALFLKELGFRDKCLGWFLPETFDKGNIPSVILGGCMSDWTKFGDRLSAPLKSQALDFLHSNTDYEGYIVPSIKESKFDWLIINSDTEERIECSQYYENRFDAESDCIDYIIKLIKKV